MTLNMIVSLKTLRILCALAGKKFSCGMDSV